MTVRALGLGALMADLLETPARPALLVVVFLKALAPSLRPEVLKEQAMALMSNLLETPAKPAFLVVVLLEALAPSLMPAAPKEQEKQDQQ